MAIDSTHQRRIALRTPEGFLAFGFGAGLSPRAPGTVGTLVAVPLAWGLKQLPPMAYELVVAAAFLFGIWLCGRVAAALGQSDPGGIVWDEFVGFWVAVALVPVSWFWWLAAFAVFRFFDIAKPWPVAALDRHFGGGFGVMVDDLAAGIYTLAVLAAAQWLIQLV